MTIHATVRSELSETAQTRGWTRRCYGTGFATDEYTRDDDTLRVQFNPGDNDTAVRVQINGHTISDFRGFHQRQALDLLRADRHVRRLRNLEDDPDFVVPGEILAHNFEFGDNVPGCGIRVGAFDGGFTVWCTDHVANDWCEWFPDLSSALARVAQVVYCGEQNWDRAFDGPADAFERSVRTFLYSVTR